MFCIKGKSIAAPTIIAMLMAGPSAAEEVKHPGSPKQETAIDAFTKVFPYRGPPIDTPFDTLVDEWPSGSLIGDHWLTYTTELFGRTMVIDFFTDRESGIAKTVELRWPDDTVFITRSSDPERPAKEMNAEKMKPLCVDFRNMLNAKLQTLYGAYLDRPVLTNEPHSTEFISSECPRWVNGICKKFNVSHRETYYYRSNPKVSLTSKVDSLGWEVTVGGTVVEASYSDDCDVLVSLKLRR